MWKLGNRVFIVLVCALSGCVILYNIWGSAFGVIITLLLVIYASVLLLGNDNLQTPHALLLLEYIERAGRELYNLLQSVSCQTTTYTLYLIETAKTFYQNHIVTRMDRRRRNTYQLSSETFINSSRNTEFGMVDGLTPIAKNRRRSYISGSENNSGIDSANSLGYDDGARSLDKVTSTPLVQWGKRESRNGDMNHREGDITVSHQTELKRTPSLYLNDPSMSRNEETVYSPRGSPWGTSISPKMRPRAAGVKTVQTVAGPLLTSTRYNIDPKVYADVTSPGLTSRLTKYATEANMKLIHQSQYSTGQFPRVNLNASPTPIINTRSPRVRTSVTVRVAPPETTKYSPPERQKILSTMYQTKNKTPPSVAQVLKEISLKRHASRDDVTVDLAKKQRTDGIHNDELENYEEITQKRGRDDLSKSEGEISIENKSLRPSKRTKVPSCYDILNSLSSSTNVSSGVKRKADLSRSGTPDIGKHFKSLDSIQRSSSFSNSAQQDNIDKSKNDSIDTELDDTNSSRKSFHTMSPKEISPYMNSLEKPTFEHEKKLNGNNPPINLTDRLFMRAEPQNIDKLKSLIEEHGKVTSKFTVDDDDEIKKSDVVIMRQTSMKARLQSMFDAISGKISGQIDPNVVIQAEQINSSTTLTSTSSLVNIQSSSSALITLNSSTSTTSLNTSPISTSAVVPIIGKAKTNTTPGKHVTFMLPSATTTPTTSNNTISSTTSKPSIPLSSANLQHKSDEPIKFEKKENSKPLPSLFGVSSTTNATSTPAFLSPSSNITVSTTSNAAISSTSYLSTNVSSPIALPTLSNSSKLFTPASTNPPPIIAFSAPQPTTQRKIQSETLASFSMASAKPVATNASTVSFSFGTSSIVSAATTATTNPQTTNTITQSTPTLGFQSTTMSAPTVSPISTSSTNLFAANKPTVPTLFTSSTSISSSAITTPVFSFGQSSSQSTVNPPPQGAFSFSSPNNSSVNLGIATTTESQVSTTPQTVVATTPSAFTFGGNSSNTSASTFGINNPSVSKTTSTIGTNNSIVIATTGSTAVTTSSSMFSFGTIPAATKPAFSFGSSNNSQATVANTPLTFGVSGQPSVSAFNSNNSNLSSMTANTQNPPAFGTISTTTSQCNATLSGGTTSFAFGTSSLQQSTFPPTSASTTNANPSIPQFGVTPKSTETPKFAMSSTANMSSNFNTSVTCATTPSSLFNNANSSNNIFGQSKAMPSTGAFGTPSSTSSNFASNPSDNFGSTGQSLSLGIQQPMTTTGFGTSPAVISMSTSAFATSNITTPAASSAVSPPPAFGVPNSSTSSGFGTLKSITPDYNPPPPFGFRIPSGSAFGEQNQNTATAFNTPTPAFAAVATTTTTTTAPPAFGAATSSTSTFGTSSSFGSTNPPPPTFGSSTKTAFSGGFGGTNSTNPISPFGNPSSNTPAFGSSNTPTLPFGTPSTNNGSAGSSGSAFSFGNTPANQSQQQNSPFTFGGVNTNNHNNNSNNNNSNNNNNNAAGAAAPFQFGATTTPQSGGFNFTGGTPAPSFGGSSAGSSSSGGGMFSIGSGSTAPRSRSARTRRQQR